MKNISLARPLTLCSILLAGAACGSSSPDVAGDDVTGSEDIVIGAEGSDNDEEIANDAEEGVPVDDGDPVVDDDLPIGAGVYPIGSLVVTVTHPELDNVEFGIDCFGDTATVTPVEAAVGEQACLALGDPAVMKILTKPADPNLACTEQYGSAHVAKIVGVIDDVQVDATIDRVNGCGIGAWHGLDGILPTPE